MKKTDKFILLLLGLVALLITATIGYRLLTDHYTPENIPFTSVAEENTNSNPLSTDNTNPSHADSDSAETTKVPNFTVYDSDNNALSLYDCLGKPIVLNFWATWCGPCKQEMPAFDQMYQNYKEQVTFLMVNVTDGSRDTVESVTDFYAESGYTFPIYFDTTLEAASTYGAYSIPMTFFIDSAGNLLYYQMGAIPEETLAQCMEILVQTTTKE